MKRSLLLAACGLAILTSLAVAQLAAPTGLDTLSDEKLMSDLAARGQANLLERAFDLNRIPQTSRDDLRAVLSLRQLTDPTTKPTASQRRQLLQQGAAAVDSALPLLNEPAVLMELASALLDAGVDREAKIIEYWGENAKLQTSLRPMAQAVVKLLDKAATAARQKADDIANTIAGPDDPRAAQWEQMSTIATAAAYGRHMADYHLALSLDDKDPRRKEIAASAIAFLQQYDNADSNVQAAVRLAIAKLRTLREEFAQAQELFATIVAGADITPPPDLSQQWEARLFIALSHLLAGEAPAAQKALNELTAWQKDNLKDPTALAGADVATSMLEYRIASAQNAQERAVAILMELVKKRPDLQAIIFEQLLSKLPPGADIKTLDPLLLQGYVAAADVERQKAESEPVDRQVLQRGVDAALEMLGRKEKIDPQLRDTAAVLIGFFLERLGQHAQAVNAFLDYCQSAGATPENQQIALDNAQAIIAQLRANPATATAPETAQVYERFLPIAINPPFSRREFAYEYARRLQIEGKFAPAIDYYRLVPGDDQRYPLARFSQMQSLQQRLDEQLPPAERQQIVSEILTLVDEISTRISAGLTAATDENQRVQYRSMLASALLIAADVARKEQNNPQRAIALLERFESLATGLPDERELLGVALHTRVQAHISLGNSDAATQALVALLRTRGGAEGAGIVVKLLQKLGQELEAARVAGDAARMKQLARNRAQLTGFLIDWARNNPDPNIQKYAYRYRVVDAATKHLAADLEDDPAKQRAQWQEVLALYQELESPAAVEQYRATLDPKVTDVTYPDPAVSLGIGLVAYRLGNYAEAQQRLGRLLTDRKLGTPTIAIEESGQTKLIDNDQYWEATLALMRSNVALAAANPQDANAAAAKQETTNYLKQLYVRYGRNVGGAKWSAEFEKLRQELAPELDPDEFTVQTTQPAA